MAPLTAYELQRQARLAANRAQLLSSASLPPPPSPPSPPPPAAAAPRRAPLLHAAARRSSSRLAGVQKDYHEPSATAALPQQARPLLASSGERRWQKLQPGECKLEL
eukprot:SM000127S26672  [mRNA]  locus=s127:299700:300378:- [translate_table: standard]